MGPHSDVQDKIDRAIALRDSGRPDDAKELLLQALAAKPDAVVALLVLGSILWDAEELEEALVRFKNATELRPSLEMASLPVFHVLWQLDRRNEAFDEMRRFLSVSDSQEYRRLIWEFKHMNRDQDDDS